MIGGSLIETQNPLVIFPVCIFVSSFFVCVLYPLQPSIKSCDELYYLSFCSEPGLSETSLRNLTANAQERPQILKDWTGIQTERLGLRFKSKWFRYCKRCVRIY